MNSKLNTVKTKLLIIPCSKIKRPVINTSALKLYDGPFFRMIRKYNPDDFDILILSAKYGMIQSNSVISCYDQKMTEEQAKKLSCLINGNLTQFLVDKEYENVYINLGKIYFKALEPSMNLFKDVNVHFASGGIGMRLQQLKKWISG